MIEPLGRSDGEFRRQIEVYKIVLLVLADSIIACFAETLNSAADCRSRHRD